MSFLQFTDRRKTQLDAEQQIDLILYDKYNKCPEIFVQYFIWRRQINREQFQKVNDANIFNKYGTINDNMDEISKHQEELLKYLSNDNDICEYLKETYLISKN